MRSWKALFVLSLVFYVALGSYQLHLPGVSYDEALDAVPAMQVVLGQPLDNEATFRLFGREWPLMVMSYVGVTTTYLVMPFFQLLGVSYEVLRIANLVVGLVTLGLIWGFLREYLDERVAAISTLLLAVNPTFLFWSRFGAYVSLPMLPLGVIALWALYRWYRGGRKGPLFLAAFALGLGLSTKLLFLWFWMALLLAWLLLAPILQPGRGPERWLWPLRRASPTSWLLAGGLALAGSAPLLLFNLREGFRTFRFMARNAVKTELYGVNNLDIVGNLRTVIFTDFPVLLDGSWFTSILGGPHHNYLALPAFLLAAGWLLWLAARGQLPFSGRRLALLGILLVAIVGQSAFTITGLGAFHLMILWPIPQALLAAALLALHDRLRGMERARQGMVAVVALVALLGGAELWTTLQYHCTLAQTGGKDYFSNAIFDLAADLEEAGVYDPVALDWGFRRNLQLISRGRINPIEGFKYTQQPGEDFDIYINWRVTQAPTLYLFHHPDETAFRGHWERFEAAAYRHRLVPKLWNAYYQGDGEPIYELYRLEPAARLFERPEVEHPLDVRLGDTFTLFGYDLPEPTARAGEPLSLTLHWQARVKPPASYKVFVHLLDEHGENRGQHDGIPVDWGYPTTEWAEGEVVADRIRLPLDASLPPGRYRLFAGMYDEATGQRLPVWLDGEPQAGDTFLLAEISVE